MSDDDTKKKSFNPYLTPTEHEDDPKLVDEEEQERPKTDDEEYADEDTEMSEDEVIVVEEPQEEIIEEDIPDERTMEKPASLKETVAAAAAPRSWSYHAATLLFLQLFSDLVVQRLGAYFFWTPRSVYILSYALRSLVLLIAATAWYRSAFRNERRTMVIVFVWVGLVSGGILGLMRFMGTPSFWSFVNMAIEPIDSALIAAAAAIIGAQALSLVSFTKAKQTV